MHPTNRVRELRFGILVLLSLVVGGASATGQEPAPPPRTDPAAAKYVGTILVPIGGSQQLTMTTKKKISNVFLSGEGVAQVAPTPEPTALVVRGMSSGTVRLELTDVDGKKESYEIIVQLDIAYLKSILHQAVKTANVDIIPTLNQTVILSGWVANAEDVDVIMNVAASILGGGRNRIINAMKVGGVMQVQLDVTIASVSRSEARKRGFNFLFNGSSVQFASILGGLAQQAQGSVGVGRTGLLANSPTGTNIVLGIVPWNFLGLLEALRDEALAKVLAEPKMVTLSGRPAHFLSGGQQAVVSAQSGITGPGVEYHDVGTEVDVLPIVLGNGRIYLEVNPRFRARNDAKGITINGALTPGFDEQSIRTAIELEPGQTMAIGGLIQTAVLASSHRVPVVGDLPYVGGLFNRVSHEEEEQELVILVTPHLVDGQDCAQLTKRLPGRETRSPDDYELFLENILEAPRGQRTVFENGKYKAAYKNDPTFNQMPCADPLPKEARLGGRRGGADGCGTDNCAPGRAPDALSPAMNRSPAMSGDGEVIKGREGVREVLPPPLSPRNGTIGQGKVSVGPPPMPPPINDDQ